MVKLEAQVLAALPGAARFRPSRGQVHWSCLATLVTLLACGSAFAGLSLPQIFGNNMVVQRGRPIPVWGQASPGAEIVVRLGDHQASAKAEPDGRWQLALPPVAVGGPYTLTLTGDGNVLTLTNILCGDVWLCSGQSNMQLPVKEVAAAEQQVVLVNRAGLRLCSVAKRPSPKPLISADIQWRVCTPESVRDFSAVACFFGSELLKDPALANVPLGLVDSSFGGTTCEGWIPAPALAAFKPEDLHDSMFGIKPANLYDGMIAPLGHTPFKGVLWYQGESNSGHPDTYAALLTTMIAAWRQQFAEPELPFLIVQLPEYANLWEGFYWPWIREMQAKAVQSISNTALVVTLGTTDGFDLHPKEKLEVGRRAARQARKLVYGESLIASGPEFKEATVEGSSIRARFDTGGDGLASTTSNDVAGFALAGADGEYRFADARIQGESVLISSAQIPEPKTVRYAWAGMPRAGLINKSGLPAAPFRTDRLPCTNVEVQKQRPTRRVATSTYEVVIDAEGKVTSLVFQGAQFLSNEPGMAGGSSIPGFWGARTLTLIQELGPRLLACGDGEVTLRMAFDEQGMRWTINNNSKDAIAFQLALSPHVAVAEPFSDGKVTLARGTATLGVDGFESITNTPTGALLLSTIKSGAAKTISFHETPVAPSNPLRLVSIGPDPVYQDMLGLRTNGWLGSDDGESIVLSKDESLWLFGDTFIGPLRNGVRVAGAPMIHSTIAIQDRTKRPPDCLKFYWKENHGRPESFFPHQAGTPGDYYWVTKGVLLKGELFLFAWCISGGEAQGLFGWKEAGSALIRVPNPLEPPVQWVQKVFPLKLAPGTSFHSALLVQPPYVYLYGIVQPRQTALARIRIGDLIAGKLTEAYEYWVNGTQGPHWGKEATNCVPQFQPVNSECTVHYEPAWKLYTCFTYDIMSPELFLTTSRSVTGPWSKPRPIYTVPEYKRFSFPIMAYAVRQHPELSTRPGEIILTYATNIPNSERELFTPEGKDVYVHRFVRAEFELNP
jgi:sialate O-acetylesterase